MPKRFRRKVSRKRRKGKRASKRRSFGHSRGKKYGSGFPAPVQLRMRAGGYPPMQKTKLRFCSAFVLNPRAQIPGAQSSLVYAAISTNALVGPVVGAFTGSVGWTPYGVDTTSPCYMHHDDYSQVYSNYRVTGTRLTIACSPQFVDRNIGGPAAGEPVPTYITLQNANTLPGSTADQVTQEAADCMSKINSMRADGKRFIKVDPLVMMSGSNVRSSGKQARTYATTAWSSKWIKHGTDPADTQATVVARPQTQQYFLISGIPGSSSVSVDACPVRVQFTLEASVTYWRKKAFQCIPTVADIPAPQPPHHP